MSANKSTKIQAALLPLLKQVTYPGFELDIIALEAVKEAYIKDGKAVVKMSPVSAPAEKLEQLENAIAQAVVQAPGVKELELELPQPKEAREPQVPQPLPGVKKVVPVASGKGGVGKSTVAVNLALGLAAQGLKAGLLDLDLYGPSIPLMLGLKGAEPQIHKGKMLPIEAHGIKVLSIGFMIDAEKALIWRGPLIMKAVRQLIHDTQWAPLDVLILDLPPGTGDVQLTMTQSVPVTAAVVVTTPQDVALVDSIKAVDMFRQTGAKVLGVVENMSYFICPDCESRHEIFGHGSVEPLALRLGTAFLGELPLDSRVREQMDKGLASDLNNSEIGKAYRDLALKVSQRLGLEPDEAA